MVAAVLLVSVTFIVFTAASPAFGVCRSRTASIAFRIWWGAENGATINFNGHSYTDGGSTNILWGCGQNYPISVGFAENPFRQWASDAGTFSNQAATSATFYPSGDSGHIAMVMNLPALTSGWGGYIGDLHHLSFPPGYQYSTHVQFTLPQSSYNSAPSSGDDVMLVWTGLGGWNGGLWQAGVRIVVHSGGANSFQEFTDYCSGSAISTCQGETLYNDAMSPGDQLSVIVWYSTSSGAQFSIQNLGPYHTWTRTGSCSGCTPDLTTGEVVVEPEYETGIFNQCHVPSGGGYCVLPNFGSIPVPSNLWTVPGGSWCAALLRTEAQGQYPSGNTYAIPGYITSGGLSVSGSFSWTYSSSP
jgi:hypothetical protein